MFGLRSKILLGFGGLLLMLVAVSLLGETVLKRYSGAMQRTFREDYTSVESCEDFAHGVDGIDTALQLHFWKNVPLNSAELERRRQICDAQLQTQQSVATLPGEKEITERLARCWDEYKQIYPHFLDTSVPEADRRSEYAQWGLSKAIDVQTAAHELIDMNMSNMLKVQGHAGDMAGHFTWAMHLLTGCAVALSAVFALLIGRFILQPVRVLTHSVRDIEHGNLDLRVPIRSKDELGVLAAAINAMAAQLKAYRQADHERLVRTERTTQLAIDSLPDAVVVVGTDSRVEMANEAARRLFKLVPGANINDLPAPWLVDLHRRTTQAGQAPALSGYEATIQVEEDGETRYFLPRTVPIAIEGRDSIGATIVLADVSDLRRLDEMKNGLLSLVSHELKTPLTSVRMVLHLVTEERVGPLNPKQKELLDAARDDAERLYAIIENLLDMARIESGRALMEPQLVSAEKLMARAAASLRGAFDAQEVELAVSVPENLPQVNADPARICHVLTNLLGNSLRYVEPGGHVSMWARLADNCVEMGVTDDGAGIPKQYLSRVFEKFFRAPGQGSATGSGLGLSIARDIVQAHGGKIRVSSAEGRGATFAFTLPPGG